MKSLVHQIALVSEVSAVSMDSLASVSAALQRQIMRDFQPIWRIGATVNPYRALESVPLGAWPIIVTDEKLGGAAGVHNEKANGQPFALVETGTSWSLTASHECLEMLVDPAGRRVMPGPSPKEGQGEVEFLVEVCDPCEDARYAYTINGTLLSEFYTPSYFDHQRIPGALYSLHGAIEAPRQVLQGGYLSWRDPETNHWFQEKWFDDEELTFRDLGPLVDDGRSFRTQIDEKTPEREALSRVPAHAASMTAAQTARDTAARAAAARATSLRTQVAEITRSWSEGHGVDKTKKHAA